MHTGSVKIQWLLCSLSDSLLLYFLAYTAFIMNSIGSLRNYSTDQ